MLEEIWPEEEYKLSTAQNGLLDIFYTTNKDYVKKERKKERACQRNRTQNEESERVVSCKRLLLRLPASSTNASKETQIGLLKKVEIIKSLRILNSLVNNLLFTVKQCEKADTKLKEDTKFTEQMDQMNS